MNTRQTRPTRVWFWYVMLAGMLLSACSTGPGGSATQPAVLPPETATAIPITLQPASSPGVPTAGASTTGPAYPPPQASPAAPLDTPAAGVPQATQTNTAFLPVQPNAAGTQTAGELPLSGATPGTRATAYPGAAANPTAVPADPAATGAPTGAEGTRRLLHNQLGYALRFPAEYDVAVYADNGLGLIQKSLLNVEAPRLDITASPAQGQALGAAVEKFIADYPGFDLPRSEITLGGEPAVVLDRVPGQEMQRVILAIHGDRLYVLRFTPADPAHGAFRGMEQLYQAVTGSFEFDPEP